MAIDTREKRQTAVDLLVPIFSPGVDPSSLDQAERQASAWVYSGILASGAAVGHPAMRRWGGSIWPTGGHRIGRGW